MICSSPESGTFIGDAKAGGTGIPDQTCQAYEARNVFTNTSRACKTGEAMHGNMLCNTLPSPSVPEGTALVANAVRPRNTVVSRGTLLEAPTFMKHILCTSVTHRTARVSAAQAIVPTRHTLLVVNHRWMQSKWKTCPQHPNAILRPLSVAWTSISI